jgi:hypothetical protein
VSTPSKHEVTRRQGGVYLKSVAELEREIKQMERHLAGLREALWRARIREKGAEL